MLFTKTAPDFFCCSFETWEEVQFSRAPIGVCFMITHHERCSYCYCIVTMAEPTINANFYKKNHLLKEISPLKNQVLVPRAIRHQNCQQSGCTRHVVLVSARRYHVCWEKQTIDIVTSTQRGRVLVHPNFTGSTMIQRKLCYGSPDFCISGTIAWDRLASTLLR